MSIEEEKERLTNNQTDLLTLYNNYKSQTQVLLNNLLLDQECNIIVDVDYLANVNLLNNQMQLHYENEEGVWRNIETKILLYQDPEDEDKTIARYQGLNTIMEAAIDELTTLINTVGL